MRQRQPPLGCHALQQGIGQQRNVSGPVAQRRQGNGEGAETKVQVFAEPALAHHLLQRPVRGGHHADVGMPHLGAAHAAVGAVFKQAQQFHLHGQRNVAHLVQEQCATAGCFHQTGPAGVGPGERATFMAEQFRLEQGFGQAGAFHRHQRALGTRAGLVHGTRNQLFARARLAQ